MSPGPTGTHATPAQGPSSRDSHSQPAPPGQAPIRIPRFFPRGQTFTIPQNHDQAAAPVLSAGKLAALARFDATARELRQVLVSMFTWKNMSNAEMEKRRWSEFDEILARYHQTEDDGDDREMMDLGLEK